MKPAQVVCFGTVIPALVLGVDEFPEQNTGMFVRHAAEFISDDAAIVACLLRGWNVRSGLIGTTLGNDARGRRVVRELQSRGVLGRLRLSNSVSTPYEVNVSDTTGRRTYFWQRTPETLETLDTAPLGLLRGARVLYVDWYDGAHILRPMDRAAQLGIPVFLNLEHGHQDPDLLALYAPRATFCQVTTDPAQLPGDGVALACKLMDAGIEYVLLTLGADGCVAAARHGQIIRVYAPSVPVVDGCGAGATFSAGILYGYLRRWSLEDSAKFAVAAASLKCTVIGPRAFPLAQVKRLARDIRVAPIRV